MKGEDNVLGAKDNNSPLGELDIRKTEFYAKRPQDMARLS
jgi:hypothetical protein